MPREVNPPRVYDSPRPAALADASRSVNMAASSSAPSARSTSVPAAVAAPPPKKAPSLKKSVRKSTGSKQAGRPPPALLQSSLLGASTFTFPVDDDFQSLLSTEPILAPPRYAARISLAGINLASSDAGSPARAYPTPLTPPSSQDHHDDAQAPAARKARDSGFVGSDEAGEADAYHVMLSARASQRSKSQPFPPLASSSGRRAFSHAPQSPLKTSLVRPRKRAPSMLASPNKGADANSPNPKARKQAKPSAPSKSLSDHRFTFSTPGAGPSRRTATTAPRTERPAKKSTLSQSVKTAATQRRKSAPVSLPKGVPIRRTAMDPNMPPPPPSPSDDPILLKGAERIRFLEPSPGADEARAAQDRRDAEDEDELGFSAAAPRATEAAPPKLASLDQSSDREVGDVELDDDDYWGGGMDGMEVGGTGFEVSGVASDSDADSGEDADNTFYPQTDAARHQELRLSDLDSIRALVPLAGASVAQPRDTTPREATPNPPTPQRTLSQSPVARPLPSPSPSPRPRSHSVTPAPASSSPAPRLRSPTVTPPAQLAARRSLSVTPVALHAAARSPSGTPPAHLNHRYVPSETPVARQPAASSPASTPAHSLAGQSSPSRTPLTEPFAQHSLAVGLTPTFQRFAVRSPSGTPTARSVGATPSLAATPEPLEVAVQPPSSTPSPAQQLAVAGTPTSQLASSQPLTSETPFAQYDAVADTPAPALSPYVFGPPRTPESYSGSEPDEESQARHSLVPDPDADQEASEAPRSEDSFFGEIDRQWEARDPSLDAAGWGARVRSSLSPDSTDDGREEAEDSEEEQGEEGPPHPLAVPVQQPDAPQPLAREEEEEDAPELALAEALEQDAPQLVAAESVLPDAVEILADEMEAQEPPQLVVETQETNVPPAVAAEIEAQDATEILADETAHEHDAGDGRDSEEEALNGDDESAASDSDHTHAMTDRGEDADDDSGGDDDDDDADSFFGEIEQKSLLEEMEEDQDDPSSVLDVTTGAFDLASVQLEEFRAFVNAVDDPESHGAHEAVDHRASHGASDDAVALPAQERHASEPPVDQAPHDEPLEAPLAATSVVDVHDEVDVPLIEDVDVDAPVVDEDDQPLAVDDVQLVESDEPLREDDELAPAVQELHSEDAAVDNVAPEPEEPAPVPLPASSAVPVADAPSPERLRSPSPVREVVDVAPDSPADGAAPPRLSMEPTADVSVELNESSDDSISNESMHDRSPSPARQATPDRPPIRQARPPASPSPVRRAPSIPSSSPIHRTPLRESHSPERLCTSLASSSALRVEQGAVPVAQGWSAMDTRAADGDRSLNSATEPWIKVSSNDPRQAARATAFLKLFHDYVETGADPNASTTSSARDRSFASRMSSLDTSRRRSSANWAADLSMVSVADDLLMEAEQEIALEEDKSADADMAYEDDEDDEDDEELPIPGSFTRATSTQSLGSLMREREAPPRRTVVVDRPWGPAEWRALMESLDAVGPAASTDAVIARLMQRTNVEAADLVGEWSRSKLGLRVASIQQRRQNEKARSSAKRRRSHHPQKALLLPNKASSPAFSRRPAAQAASSSARAARRSPGAAGGEPKTTTLAGKVLGFLNRLKRAPPPAAVVVGAARPRTSSIPEFLMSSPALRPVIVGDQRGRRPTPPPSPQVIAPSSPSVGRPSGDSTSSRPAPATSASSSHGFVPLRQLSFGGSSPSAAVVPSALPAPPASTSHRQPLPSAPAPSRIPTSSIPIPIPSSSRAPRPAPPTDLPARARSSRPSVSALVKSFEAARSFDELHASHGHHRPSFRG